MKTAMEKLEQLNKALEIMKKDDDSAYHEMLIGMINEMGSIEEKLTAYHQSKKVSLGIMRAKQEWERYLDEFIEIISEWLAADFESVKRKKYYLDMEDLMAEVDDWIEAFDEEHEEMSLNFPYIESWDVGLFLG